MNYFIFDSGERVDVELVVFTYGKNRAVVEDSEGLRYTVPPEHLFKD